MSNFVSTYNNQNEIKNNNIDVEENRTANSNKKRGARFVVTDEEKLLIQSSYVVKKNGDIYYLYNKRDNVIKFNDEFYIKTGISKVIKFNNRFRTVKGLINFMVENNINIVD